MKILMMRPTYRPELSGGTHLAIDLVEDIIKSGHQLEMITPIQEKYCQLVDESTDECKIHRITSRFNKKDVLSRILRYIDISWKMYKLGMSVDADLIMTHSMPPLLGPLGARLGRKKHVPVLYWEQDIVSESLISTGIMGTNSLKHRFSYKIARMLESKSENGSTHIITISELFKNMHVNRGVDPNKISVVYNWIDTNQIYPVKKENNPLFEELNIPKDKFIVSYCGNLGVPQNVEIMIDAAEKLKNHTDILFVLLGGGSREKYIKEYVATKNLPNLIFGPLQPLERSHYVYSIGDVGLVIGKRGTSHNGFPSKTWSIMAAGQTMIACFDEDSELSSFVNEGKCGLAIEPDNSDKLAEAILQLSSNRSNCAQMGLNARNFVCGRFNRQQATKSIIAVAEELIEK